MMKVSYAAATETFTEEVSEAVTAAPVKRTRLSVLTTRLRPKFYSNRPKEGQFIVLNKFLITESPKSDLNCVSI